MNANPREAETDDAIERCHRVIHQLRSQIPAEGWVARVRRLQASGYRLAFVEEGGQVVAAAGFRLYENLYDGMHLHVDDLVSDGEARSSGHGARLLEWLVALARREGCQRVTLDSGVTRFAAHRFYLRQRFDIRSHHFVLGLGDEASG